MKSKISIILMILFGLILVGCDDDDTLVTYVIEDISPATPQGIYSVTGDEAVYVYWNGIYEHDVKEYVVYRSPNRLTGYVAIAVVPAVDNPNLDLIVYEYLDDNLNNGGKYWYAVASVDFADQISELSAEDVYDVPRPEGQVTLFSNSIDASLSGFNLITGQNVYDTSGAADVYVDSLFGIYYLNAANLATDIQDVGYTSYFDDVDFAPTAGWSDLGFVEIILGHTYIIWTAEYHFAKMRAISINASGSITFQWAYQTRQDETQLAPPRPDPESKMTNSKQAQLVF